jgi:hypothetical protein
MSQQNHRHAISVKRECTRKENVDGMTVYQLPLKKQFNAKQPMEDQHFLRHLNDQLTSFSNITRFSFGQRQRGHAMGQRWKTILLMGATGSGKLL